MSEVSSEQNVIPIGFDRVELGFEGPGVEISGGSVTIDVEASGFMLDSPRPIEYAAPSRDK